MRPCCIKVPPFNQSPVFTLPIPGSPQRNARAKVCLESWDDWVSPASNMASCWVLVFRGVNKDAFRANWVRESEAESGPAIKTPTSKVFCGIQDGIQHSRMCIYIPTDFFCKWRTSPIQWPLITRSPPTHPTQQKPLTTWSASADLIHAPKWLGPRWSEIISNPSSVGDEVLDFWNTPYSALF